VFGFKVGLRTVARLAPFLPGRQLTSTEVIARMPAKSRSIAPDPGGMSVSEAGRRGGNAVKSKYGREYYSDIGRKGGAAIAKERGASYYSEIGKKGGETVKRNQGAEFYSEIGRKGGEALRSKHGPEYYSRIGKKGGASRARGSKPT
jgi:general stress protein YciG